MMASANAIEMFFSTWGACAKTGAVANTEIEASSAILAECISGLPDVVVGLVMKPKPSAIILATDGKVRTASARTRRADRVRAKGPYPRRRPPAPPPDTRAPRATPLDRHDPSQSYRSRSG